MTTASPPPFIITPTMLDLLHSINAMTHHRREIGGVAALLLLVLVIARCAGAQPPSPDDWANKNPYGFFPIFIPPMAIVIVVLIGASIFHGFFSVYVRHCRGGERIASIRSAAAAARSRRNLGLNPEKITEFPTLVYSEVKGMKIGKGALECAVCLSEFEDEETLRLLLRCSHVFHPDCIDAWLAGHVTCPVCRSNLAETLPEPDPPAPEAPSDPAPEVVIEVGSDPAEGDGNRKEEMADLARIASRIRPGVVRSHSTGHSLAVEHRWGDVERFTLRLPEGLRREIVAAGRVQRAASMRVFPTAGSSRRGYRGGEGGSSRGRRSVRLGRSDRWPSTLARTISARISSIGKRWERDDSMKKGGDGSIKRGGDDEGSVSSVSNKLRPASVRVQFADVAAGESTVADARV